MNRKSLNLKIGMVGLVLALAVMACNMPLSQKGTATPDLLPSMNMTLTALYEPLSTQGSQPTPNVITATKQVLEATSTSTLAYTPTNTEVPVTATPVPPTKTVGPVVTATSQPRPGPAITGAFLNSSPTIDGNWGEWKTEQFPLRIVVYGGGNWKGKSDLDGAFRVGWDTTNLYLAYKITDQKYVQTSSGEGVYKGDMVEVLIDTNLYGDYLKDSDDGDDFQLGISLGSSIKDGTRETYLWLPKGSAGNLSSVVVAGEAMDDGYRMEIAIPWSVLGVTPARNMKLGFCVSISDNDTEETAAQESMVSNCGDRSFLNPTTWGTLELVK